MNFTIRQGVQNDYESVEKVMQEAQKLHTQLRPDIYKSSKTVYAKDYFSELIENKLLYVAEMNNEAVGLVSIKYRHIESDKQITRDIIFIDDLVVLHQYNGMGIGTALINFIKEKVKSENLDGLELQVNALNVNARAFYEKIGFSEKSVNLELL